MRSSSDVVDGHGHAAGPDAGRGQIPWILRGRDGTIVVQVIEGRLFGSYYEPAVDPQQQLLIDVGEEQPVGAGPVIGVLAVGAYCASLTPLIASLASPVATSTRQVKCRPALTRSSINWPSRPSTRASHSRAKSPTQCRPSCVAVSGDRAVIFVL